MDNGAYMCMHSCTQMFLDVYSVGFMACSMDEWIDRRTNGSKHNDIDHDDRTNQGIKNERRIEGTNEYSQTMSSVYLVL